MFISSLASVLPNLSNLSYLRLGNSSSSNSLQNNNTQPFSNEAPTFVKVQPTLWDSKAIRILGVSLPIGLASGVFAGFSQSSYTQYRDTVRNPLVHGLGWAALVTLGGTLLGSFGLPYMKSSLQAAKNRYEDTHDVRLLPVPDKTDVFRQVPILTRAGDMVAYDARGVQGS